jgi:hypothetical protein
MFLWPQKEVCPPVRVLASYSFRHGELALQGLDNGHPGGYYTIVI